LATIEKLQKRGVSKPDELREANEPQSVENATPWPVRRRSFSRSELNERKCRETLYSSQANVGLRRIGTG